MAGAALPEVIGVLHGGPHDGERISMPWPHIDMSFSRWRGNFPQPGEDLYRLRRPYRGQALCHYDFVEFVDRMEPATEG